MMELCDISTDGYVLDGKSLVPLLRSPDVEDRIAYSIMSRGRYVGYSLRTPRFRYTEYIYIRDNDMWAGMALRLDTHITTMLAAGAEFVPDETELYDFADGPLEKVNVAFDPANADVLAQLSLLLRLKTEGARTRW
jgi:hypothetical protein